MGRPKTAEPGGALLTASVEKLSTGTISAYVRFVTGTIGARNPIYPITSLPGAMVSPSMLNPEPSGALGSTPGVVLAARP